MNDIGTSYLLWLGWFFGVGGLHRLYNKKYVSGLVWLCTWGLFGFGQLLDLLLIPGMVQDHNLQRRLKLGWTPNGVPLNSPVVVNSEFMDASRPPATASGVRPPEPKPVPKDRLMIELAKVAQARGGKISVTQAVIDTGVSFDEVEATLQEMVKRGYVGVDNHPDNGVVLYEFLEL